MRGAWRRLLFYILVLAALSALAYTSRHRIHLADFTWSKFLHALSQISPWWLVLSIVAIYGCYAIRALRWKRFCKHLGPARFVDVYSATIMGFASVFVLGRAGEAIRPLLLAKKSRMAVSSMFGIWAAERLFDFASAVGLATISLLVFPKKLADAGADPDWVQSHQSGGWLLLGILGALVLGMVYFRLHGARALSRRLEHWHEAGPWKRRIAAAAAGFSEGVQAIRTPSDFLAATFYSAAHWALAVLVYLWISQAFRADFYSPMNFPAAMLLLAVTLVGAVLQLPGVGGGAQVASFIALTTIFASLDQEPAVAVAVVLWLVTFASSTLVGIPLLIHEGLSMGELRRLARAEAQAEEIGVHVNDLDPLAGLRVRRGRGDSVT